MLRAGITTFADMYLFPEEAARAAAAARMRAAIGLPITDGPTVWAETATGHLAKAEQLWDEYRSHPGVSLYFAPHNAFGENDQTLARVRRVADELDARVAMYLAPGEMFENPTRRRSPLVRLQELGLLGPGFTAIHLCGVNEEELEIASTTGVCVVACPQSHLRLGGGLCPVMRLDAGGVSVGLGTDSPLSVGALDVLAEARLAVLLAGLDQGLRATAPANYVADAGSGRIGPWYGTTTGGSIPGYGASGAGAAAAETALRMATLGGATALGMSSVIGSVEVGKAADLICIDLATLACQAPRQPAEAILFGATRQQVSDVWTSGRTAVRDGRLLTFDEREMLELSRRWVETMTQG
jgi:5-methylthioadenosine/S-adenosylhomocysteine deaminase